MVWDKPGFTALKPGDGKVWVHCCEGELPYDIDTDFSVYPSLAELTQKGIELLDNPNGFFMMIEGGTLDHSGHSNDAAANLRDVLALDKAVQVGLAFAKAHADETLLIVTGDHETGGMAMGWIMPLRLREPVARSDVDDCQRRARGVALYASGRARHRVGQ